MEKNKGIVGGKRSSKFEGWADDDRERWSDSGEVRWADDEGGVARQQPVAKRDWTTRESWGELMAWRRRMGKKEHEGGERVKVYVSEKWEWPNGLLKQGFQQFF